MSSKSNTINIYLLLFLFQVGGIALIAVGGIALKKVGDVKGVFEENDHPGIFAASIIALGALVFVIAFFGIILGVVHLLRIAEGG